MRVGVIISEWFALQPAELSSVNEYAGSHESKPLVKDQRFSGVNKKFNWKREMQKIPE